MSSRWPFTEAECRALRGAYGALTRVGDATRDPAVHRPDTDFWDPLLDRARHDLGLVLAMSRADAVEAQGVRAGGPIGCWPPVDDAVVEVARDGGGEWRWRRDR